jgi:HEAT repeat protein
LRKAVLAILIALVTLPALAQEEQTQPEAKKEPPAPAEPEQPKPPQKEPTGEEIAAAVQSLTSRFAEERRAARRTLIRAGKKAVPELLKHIRDKLPARRATIVEVLGFVGGDEAVKALIAMIDDKDVSVRDEARKALARIGPPAYKQIAKALEGKPKEERKWFDGLIRDMVENSLANLVGPDGEFGDYPGQFDGIRKMGKPAVEALVEIARQTDGNLVHRYLAVTALGRLGDKSAAPVLKKIFETQDRLPEEERNVWDDAAISLALLGDDSGLKKVVKHYELRMVTEEDKDYYASALGLVYHKLEDWKKAEEWYKRAIEANPKSDAYFNYSCLLSVRGRTKEALAALSKAIENGYTRQNWIMRDGELENVRKTPEFKELMKKHFGEAPGTE